MKRSSVILFILGTLVAMAAIPAYCDEASDQLRSLVEKQAAALVTIKAVLKVEYKGGGETGDNEARSTMQGVLVTSDGLIMLSDANLSAKRYMDYMGSDGPEGFSMKITPTSLKVIFEHETKEYDAFLAASDTVLGIAFLQIENLEGRIITPIDFSTPATATIGQQVAQISRLSKGFDYTPVFQLGRINGEITKPRKGWCVSMGDFGLPVFSLTGQPIGVLCMILSGTKPDESSRGSMLGGNESPFESIIIQNATIKAIIDQAIKQSATVAAQRAAKKAEEKTEETKPTPTPVKPPPTKPNKP